MKKRYWVVLIFSLFLIVVLAIMLERDKFYFATDYNDLQLKIKTQTQSVAINPWISPSGDLYYFLPSCVENARSAKFNISPQSRIHLDNDLITYKDNVLNWLKYDTPITFDFCGDSYEGEKRTAYFFHSGQIPSVYISTKNNDISAVNDDKAYISQLGEVKIIDCNGKSIFSGGYESIKARGNSTFEKCFKKSYQLSFDKDISLLGLNSSSKWILLANAIDATSMRNRIVYDFSNRYTSVPAPNSEYIDLYIDDTYCGNYVLCESALNVFEQINEVDLEEKNIKLNSAKALLSKEQYVSDDGNVRALQDMINPDDITGGYLVECSAEFIDCRSGFITNGGLSFRIISPQNASIEQVEYIRGYFNEIEDALSSTDGICSTTNKHYSEYIDVDSWVDYYLLNEVFQDPDSSFASTYFYKQSDSVDNKVYAGPAWDYDMAMGGYIIAKNRFDDPNKLANYFCYSDYLYERDEIKDKIINRYSKLFSQKGKRTVESLISQNEQIISDSMYLDFIRWPQSLSFYYYGDFESNTDYLDGFISDKISFLDEYWCSGNTYHKVLFLDYDKNVCKEMYIKHGERIDQIPDCKAYVALFDGWYDQSNDLRLTDNTRIYEDTTFVSSWYEVDLMVLNMLAVTGCDLSNYDTDALEKILSQIQKMKNEQDLSDNE